MLRKGWEAVALFVVLLVVINVVATSIEPFLPIIGLVVSGLIVYVIVRFAIRRRF